MEYSTVPSTLLRGHLPGASATRPQSSSNHRPRTGNKGLGGVERSLDADGSGGAQASVLDPASGVERSRILNQSYVSNDGKRVSSQGQLAVTALPGTADKRVLLFTMDSLSSYKLGASKGGPSGEITVCSSLEQGFQAHGYTVCPAAAARVPSRAGV